MLLYGASGHAKVICSALEVLSIPITGIFDDNPTLKKLNKFEVLGYYNHNHLKNETIIISIGDNQTRKRISKVIQHQFGICISKNAIVDADVIIGEGSVVLQGVVIQSSCQIGKHCIVNTLSSIDHDCILLDFVHVSPSATLCGGVKIGEGTQIGAGATVIQNINIGKWCIIGAGSVITEDIPDYSVVVGVPGRIIKNIKKDDE
jgi:sugar O-acyltransferase (sialic acid O-acetyltransferase NeuD family)